MERLRLQFFIFLLFLVSLGRGEGGELIVCIVCDTYAENISEAISQDFDQIRKEAARISKHTGLDLSEWLITGENLRAKTVLKTLRNLYFQPDDIVLFYYSGHGYRTKSKKTPWPNLYFSLDKEGVDFEQVISILQKKQPRLLLAIADCCNNIVEEQYAPPLVKGDVMPKSNKWVEKNYRKLFLETKGSILIASSGVDELSWCIARGALYTLGLIDSIKRGTESSKGAEWSLILDRAARSVKRFQTPYYKLEMD